MDKEVRDVCLIVGGCIGVGMTLAVVFIHDMCIWLHDSFEMKKIKKRTIESLKVALTEAEKANDQDQINRIKDVMNKLE